MTGTSLPFVPTEAEQDAIKADCRCGGFDPGNGKWGHAPTCTAIHTIALYRDQADVRRRILDQPDAAVDDGPQPASLRSIFGSFFLMWVLSWLLFHGLLNLVRAVTGWSL